MVSTASDWNLDSRIHTLQIIAKDNFSSLMSMKIKQVQENGNPSWILDANGKKIRLTPATTVPTSDADVFFADISLGKVRRRFVLKSIPMTDREMVLIRKHDNEILIHESGGHRLFEVIALYTMERAAMKYKFPNVLFSLFTMVTRYDSPDDIYSSLLKSHIVVADIINHEASIIKSASSLKGPTKEQKNVAKKSKNCAEVVVKAAQKVSSQRLYTMDTLLICNERSGSSVAKALDSSDLDAGIIESIASQILISLSFMYNRCHILHLDAHLGNFVLTLMDKKTDGDPKSIDYRKEGVIFHVPYRGFLVTAIDFANAAFDDTEGFLWENYFRDMYDVFYGKKPRTVPQKKNVVHICHLMDVVRAMTILSEHPKIRLLKMDHFLKTVDKVDRLLKDCAFYELDKYEADILLVELFPDSVSEGKDHRGFGF